jgi:hypothetical protein
MPWLLLAVALLGCGGAPACPASEVTRTVVGRAVEEPRTPRGPEAPLTGILLTLVPRSDAFLGRLEDIKRHARDSLPSYSSAVAKILAERHTYEEALRPAQPAVVRSAKLDAQGRFTFEAVPEGEWLLLGWRATGGKRSTGQVSKGDRARFNLTPRPSGFQEVAIWLIEVSVGSPADPIELNDRNVWFSGVQEK